MAMWWFSFDPENGIEFHDSPDSAKASAQNTLDECRDYAEEGWDEQMESICWGQAHGRVVEISRRPARPSDSSDCDEIVDYALRDAPAKARKMDAALGGGEGSDG